ncbi:hypothetical protein ACFFSY_01045 [Paenibacillus aurantiacus]|uniref:Uncharacterized protein n=1 Tax=Paenibacillus aurantiacus TaxID=1936118 RepID=A0ABV5KH17_9BACL
MTMNVFTALMSLLTAAFGFATALLEYLKTAKNAKTTKTAQTDEKTANDQPAVSSEEEAATNVKLNNQFRG